MATVIGVRFKKANKVYYFDPSDVWPNAGDYVVVETVRGIELGEVVTGAREVSDDQIVAPLKKVLRMAVEEDMQRMEYNTSREPDALRICQERILQHKLEMKLVDVEYTFDGSKIIFYFTANGRVDFRELVKDLASVFKMRIELRQIGVRDEAKMLGGLGSCGRPICCRAFLAEFQPVSIKMAKEQSLSLNPTKISGQCGRLMCCLKYEQDNYEAVLKKLPKVGRDIMTPDGIGVISEINTIREKVRVRIRTADDTFDMREYRLDEVSRPAQSKQSAEEPADEPEDEEKDLDLELLKDIVQEDAHERKDHKERRDHKEHKDHRDHKERKEKKGEGKRGGNVRKETPVPDQPKDEISEKEKFPPKIVKPKGSKQADTDQYYNKLKIERKKRAVTIKDEGETSNDHVPEI